MDRSLGILCILLGWALLLPSLCGLGYLAARWAGLTRLHPSSQPDPLMLFWIGLAVLLLLLQAVHCVLPIGKGITYSIVALGYSGFVLNLFADRGSGWGRLAGLGWVLLPVAAWVAVQAAAGPENADDGLYHFQSVQWLNKERLVPGLGNLDGRLGFNQSYFLYYAFLNVRPLVDRAYHFANGLLVVVLLTQMLRSLRTVILQRPRAGAASLFQMLLLPMVIREASPLMSFRGRDLSSPSPDLPITILGVVLMTELIGLACPSPNSAESRLPRFFLIVVVGTAAITMKLSFLVTGVCCVLVAALLAWREGVKLRSRPVAVAAALSLATMLVWIARSVVTNGYPFYPSAALGLPVDWKIPLAEAHAMADSIKGFARQPTSQWRQALTGYAWLPSWWARAAEHSLIVNLLLATAGLAVLFPLCRRFGHPYFNFPLWRLLVPVGPIIASLAFWFLAAPDPRFWAAMPSSLVAWLGVLCLLHLPSLISSRIVPACVLLAATLVALQESPAHAQPKRDALGWVKLPKGDAREFVTRSGLRVFVHAPGVLQPWNHEIPLTSYPNPALVRRGHRLREGFRVAK